MNELTVLVVQCAGAHTHDPWTHGEEILCQEPLTELQLVVCRRSEGVQRVYLEELDKGMRSW